MSVPVLTAVTGAPWESQLVTTLERGAAGLAVVRRCVDLADLLAAAASGQARVALLSADLRRLDGDALSRLAGTGVAVVGVVSPGDDEARRRLRLLGVRRVLTADAPAETVAEAVREVLGDVSWGSATTWSEPAGALPDLPDLGDGTPPVAGGHVGRGRLVAVWGPTGAPGRTTVAVTLADELARRGCPTLLADADAYGGAVAHHLGLLDDAPGLVAACRAATAGRLDVVGLARHARQLGPQLRVLTGLVRADRWPELRPSALSVVWAMSRSLAAVTVVDCGFSLEQDEEISFDTMAPRRNGATLTTLEHADVVLAVGAADPVGLQRLVQGLGDLRDAVPGAEVRVVVNRLRAAAVGARPDHQVRAALERFAGVRDAVLLPDDRASCDAALLAGRTLGEEAAGSPLRRRLAELAATLVPATVGAGEERPRRRRRLPALGVQASRGGAAAP